MVDIIDELTNLLRIDRNILTALLLYCSSFVNYDSAELLYQYLPLHTLCIRLACLLVVAVMVHNRHRSGELQSKFHQISGLISRYSRRSQIIDRKPQKKTYVCCAQIEQNGGNLLSLERSDLEVCYRRTYMRHLCIFPKKCGDFRF